VTLSDIDPPNGLQISGFTKGRGGVAEFRPRAAPSSALRDVAGATVLTTMSMPTEVGGKAKRIAQVKGGAADRKGTGTQKRSANSWQVRGHARAGPPSAAAVAGNASCS